MTTINPIQLQKQLKGVDYPVSKAALLEHLERKGSDEAVRSTVERLPDRTFKTPAEVSEAIGKLE